MQNRSATQAVSRCSLNLLVFLLVSTFLPMLFALVFKLVTHSETLTNNQTLFCNYLAMYGVAFPLYLLLSRSMEKSAPEKHTMSVGSFLICIMICIALMIVGNLVGNVINLVLTTLFSDLNAFTLNDFVFNDSPYFFLVLAVICAPIIEEILLRKVFIDRVRKFGDGWAILLSGLLFGLLHGNFTQFFYAALLGAFLAFIYIKTGKLQYTIAMHMILNFIGSAVPLMLLRNVDTAVLLSENATEAEILAMLPDLIPLLLVVGIEYLIAFAGIILLCCSFRQFELEPPAEKTPASSIFSSIPLWLFIVVSLATFIIAMI